MFRNGSKYFMAIIWSLGVAGAQSHPAAGPVPGAAGAPLASTFPGPLWQVFAPLGGTAFVSNQHLFLNVPGGSNHDTLLPSNQALRVLQQVGDQDFDVSIKIDSPVLATDANTSRGLMVLADTKNFITFALVTNGTNLGLSVDTVTDGAPTKVVDVTSFNEYRNPMYLRITRSRVAYIAYYSVDGVVWSQAAAFTDPSIPTAIGPFAANYNQTPAHAVPVVMAINWFDIL